MKVHEIMTAHARCVNPDNTLVEAAGLMRELDVGVLPVCDEDRIAGMVTDRDMAVRAVADGRDPNVTPVSEIMTPGVVYIFADQQVEEAVRVMQDHEIRRLAVLDRAKRLVGIVSLGDVAVSSAPAFSGIALREVSQPHRANGRDRKRDALGRAAGAGPRLRTMEPATTGAAAQEEERGGGARNRAAGVSGTRSGSSGKRGARQQRQRKTKSSRASGSTSRRGKQRATAKKTKARASR